MDTYNIDLEDNILHFIASNLKSNVRELEGFLKRVSAYASLTQQDISMEIVENLMEDMIVPAEETAEAEAQKPKKIEATVTQLEREPSEKPELPPLPKPQVQPVPVMQKPQMSFIKPEVKESVKTLPAAFFYPEGADGDLITVKESFANIIKKHKMKFNLETVIEQTYVYDPTMKFSFFPEKCKEHNIRIAIILAPQIDSPAAASEFSDTLQTLMIGEGISLQFISPEDVSKESRYLNMALDITLQRF